MLTKSEIDFYSSAHHPYYIVAPAYRQTSAGVRALHYLCHILNEAGYEAYVTTDVTSSYLRTPLLTDGIRNRHATTDRLPIMVYPEVVPGNPLNGQVVARWLLNKPGHLGGDKTFPASELLFFWDTWVLTEPLPAERLSFPVVDSRIFNNRNNPHDKHREAFCYYAHKFIRFGGVIDPYLTENGITLCQDVARPPEEIAAILRQCKVLYCYEPSTLVREAQACGCQIIYISTPYLDTLNNAHGIEMCIRADQIRDTPVPDFDSTGFEAFQAVERADAWRIVDNFINITQNAARRSATPENKNQQVFNQALQAYQNADYAAAIELFSSLLEATPDAPLPYAYLSFVCAAQGLNDEAGDFLAQAESLAPGRQDFRAALGEAFLKAGNAPYAVHYLNAAISAQPDLFHAYPALAEGLRQTGQIEAAIALLRSAAGMPSGAQANIRTQLLESLANQGNLEAFGKSCLAFATGPAEYSLAIRMLARSDNDPAQMLSTIDFLRDNLPVTSPDETPGNPSVSRPARAQTTIAFLVSNFQREGCLGRLEALLANLPPETFFTLVIDNDPQAESHESAQRCALLVDRWLAINQQSDNEALNRLAEFSPDILIDLDGYSAAQRLTLFSMAEVPCKLSWSDLPLPPLAQSSRLLAGKALLLPGKMTDTKLLATLPGLGELYQLPAISPETRPLPQVPITTFGCLTPVIQVSQDSWQLFAQLLAMTPAANLTINLAELGDSAAEYIRSIFAGSGVAPDRLNFIHACDEAALCRHWLNIRIGLAPLHGTGDQALPTSLWMNRPYVALNSEHLWSRRPAALLESIGHPEWAPGDRDGYLAVARQLATHSDETPTLREQMQAAGLCDASAFTLGFAQTLRATCCQGMQ